jgi:hypothetical protein
VIAIIAILAAILFPVFLSAKEAAQRTKCLSNLRQIATAMERYRDDWYGYYPSAGRDEYPAPPAYSDYPHSFWVIQIDRYHKAKDLPKCPGALNSIDSRYAFPINYPVNMNNAIVKRYSAFNYGINEYILYPDWCDKSWGSWNNGSLMPLPSKTLLLADCSWALIMDWTQGPSGTRLPAGVLRTVYANTSNNTYGTNWVGDQAQYRQRHGGITQVVFADCHVRALRTIQFKYQGDYLTHKEQTSPNFEYPLIHPGARLAQ